MPHDRQLNVGETVYASYGGPLNVNHHQPLEDLFAGGRNALDSRLYPQAVRRFEDYLTTAYHGATNDARSAPAEQVATAHLLAALATLGGSAPARKTPEEIDRVNTHLHHAIRIAPAQAVGHQARVLWAVVIEDYYEADGMPASLPRADQLSSSLALLAPPELGLLATHVGAARGGTWAALAQRVRQFGLHVSPGVSAHQRQVHSGRAQAVRKYFTPTPPEQSSASSVATVSIGTVLIVAGLIAGGIALLLLLAIGGFLIYHGADGYVEYRRYRRAFAAAEPKPPEAQLDAWLADDVADLAARGATVLRLGGNDLVYRPQVVVGVAERKKIFQLAVRARRGNDGRLRATAYDVLILFLTNGLLATYRGLLNFETGDILYDEAREYHYRDIVGVSSASVPLPKEVEKDSEVAYGLAPATSLAQVFRLSVVNGEELRINIGYSESHHDAHGAVAWPNGETLNVVQRMVRARKTQ